MIERGTYGNKKLQQSPKRLKEGSADYPENKDQQRSEEDNTALTLLYIKSGFVCIQARPKSEAPDNNRDKKISDKTTYGIKIYLGMHYVLNKTERLAKTDIYTLSFPA